MIWIQTCISRVCISDLSKCYYAIVFVSLFFPFSIVQSSSSVPRVRIIVICFRYYVLTYVCMCVWAHVCVCVWSRDFDVIPRDSRDFPETTKQSKIEWLASYCYVSDYWIPGNETLYELNVRTALFPAVLQGLSTYIAIACDAGLDRLFTTAPELVIHRIP